MQRDELAQPGKSRFDPSLRICHSQLAAVASHLEKFHRRMLCVRACASLFLGPPLFTLPLLLSLGIRIGQLLLNVGVDKLTKCGRGMKEASCRWTTNRTFFHILHLSPICALNHRASEGDEVGGAAEDTFCVVSTPFTRGTPLRWQPNFTLLNG